MEAAHIYPVEKNGTDDLRNGIALCKLHHWAFDGGLFSISDALRILIKADIKDKTDYEEIYKYDNKLLLSPQLEKYKISSVFLKQHRISHGFEQI